MTILTSVVTLLTLGLVSPQTPVALQGEPVALDPIIAISAALDDHQLVALGENHGHEQFYEWLEALLGNDAIQQRVDDIVVEFGNSLHQDLLDRFISGDDVSLVDVRRVWRDTVVSPNTVWDSPVYESFFNFVRELNMTLPETRRYRVLAGDPPVDWSSVNNSEDLRPFYDRSRHYADVVDREVLNKGRHALLIAGGGHFTRVCMVRTNRQGVRWAEVTVVANLELRFPGSLYVVKSMGVAGKAYDPGRLDNLPRGALVEIADTWLGMLPGNEITTMRNYDGTPFTLYGDATFADMVDAIIYWGAESEARDSEPPMSLYRDEAYWDELNRRSHIVRGQPMDPDLRGEE